MNGDEFAALLDTLERLTAAQNDLAARVEALEHPKETSDLDPSTLPEWVEWLRSSYGLQNRIPAGWARIPGARQELAGLRAAYVTAYDDDHRPRSGFDPLQWHDALHRAVSRIEEVWHRNDVARRGGYTAAALSRRITEIGPGAGVACARSAAGRLRRPGDGRSTHHSRHPRHSGRDARRDPANRRRQCHRHPDRQARHLHHL